MIEIFRNELELCGIGRGQSVAVLSEGEHLRGHALGFLAAARELGADAEDVNLPAGADVDPEDRLKAIGRNSLSSHAGALKTCMSADLVVDHLLLLFSKEQRAMQKAGARVLMVVEPVEVLERLFPPARSARPSGGGGAAAAPGA